MLVHRGARLGIGPPARDGGEDGEGEFAHAYAPRPPPTNTIANTTSTPTNTNVLRHAPERHEYGLTMCNEIDTCLGTRELWHLLDKVQQNRRLLSTHRGSDLRKPSKDNLTKQLFRDDVFASHAVCQRTSAHDHWPPVYAGDASSL